MVEILRALGFDLNVCIRLADHAALSETKATVTVEDPLSAKRLSTRLKEQKSTPSATPIPIDTRSGLILAMVMQRTGSHRILLIHAKMSQLIRWVRLQCFYLQPITQGCLFDPTTKWLALNRIRTMTSTARATLEGIL